MRKYIKIRSFIFVFTIFSCLSMIPINHFETLNELDYQLEEVEEDQPPALSAGLHEKDYWESYNTWNCFSAADAQLDCSVLDYGKILVPTIRVVIDGIHYDYSNEPEQDPDCHATLRKWAELFENQKSVCIYSAYLQNVTDNYELWIIDQIKTYNGYWRYRNYIDSYYQSGGNYSF